MPVFSHVGLPIAQETQQEVLYNKPLQTTTPNTDPRPDLEADSNLWTKLLIKAERINPNLAGTLHGFRCGGLRIKRGRTGYLLRPDFDPTGNLATWKDQDEYEYDKLMHLFEYREEIKELMANL
ncbi:MAG: hypothetical protein KGZ96_13505 [Clostridia bacterium]|nr:hypothetical protein [Clostridia bacterium]